MSARLFEANLEILKVLGSAVAKRDSDTDSHNYRVTIISVRLAETCGLFKDDIRRLIKGAFLHDVGKIGIEDEILHKPGRLTTDEFQLMKKHVAFGIDIVNKAEWIKEAVDVVGYHHEKYDGSGYNSGIEGGTVPVIARIFAIADVFDALGSRRPYKEPLSYDETMEIIRAGRGNHFDPEYVDAFESISKSIYGNYAGREDEELVEELIEDRIEDNHDIGDQLKDEETESIEEPDEPPEEPPVDINEPDERFVILHSGYSLFMHLDGYLFCEVNETLHFNALDLYRVYTVLKYEWDFNGDGIQDGYVHYTSSGNVPQLNVDFFMRQPNLAQDGWTYTPYPYPHPLVA